MAEILKCRYNGYYTCITLPVYGGILTSKGQKTGTNVPLALPFPHPTYFFTFPFFSLFSHRNRYRKSL